MPTYIKRFYQKFKKNKNVIFQEFQSKNELKTDPIPYR